MTERPASVRRLLRLGTLTAAGLVLAACSSSPSANSSSDSTTTSSSPSTTSSTSSTGSTTTSSGATTTTCQATGLSFSAGQGNGAAGTIEETVTMTNTSGKPCTLEGYPGMQLFDSNGSAIPTMVVRGGVTFGSAAANAPVARVNVADSGTAQFTLHYSDVPVGNETTCPTSATAHITPPNNFGFATVALAIAPCGNGTVHVSPVYAG